MFGIKFIKYLWCLIGIITLLGTVKYVEVATVRADLARSLVSCILHSGRQTLWESLVERTKLCVSLYTFINESSFEHFEFLSLNPEYKGNCYVLTIGKDTQIEKEIRLLHPKCQTFEIEPEEEQSNKIRVPSMIFRRSEGETLKLSLPDLLEKYVRSKIIHFSIIDIGELNYNLLDAFKFQQSLDLAEVVFCQIDVVLHKNQQPSFDFEEFLPSFLADSPYLPIFARSLDGAQIKLTLIHIENNLCEEAFAIREYF